MSGKKEYDKYYLQKLTEKRRFIDKAFIILEELKKIKPEKEISLNVFNTIEYRKREISFEKLNQEFPDYINEIYDLLEIKNLEELGNISIEDIQEKHNLNYNNISNIIKKYDPTNKEDFMYKIIGKISSDIYEKEITKENLEKINVKNFFVTYMEDDKIKKINVNIYPDYFGKIEGLKVNDAINITGKMRRTKVNDKIYVNFDLKELEKVKILSKELPVQVQFKGNLAENPIVKEFSNNTKYINIAIYENTHQNGAKINYCTVIGDNLSKEFEKLKKGDFIEIKGEKTKYISNEKEYENIRIYSFKELKKNLEINKEELKEYFVLKGSDIDELQKYNNIIFDEKLYNKLQNISEKNKESNINEQNVYFDYLNGGEVKTTVTVKLGDINDNFVNNLSNIAKENKEIGLEDKKEEITR